MLLPEPQFTSFALPFVPLCDVDESMDAHAGFVDHPQAVNDEQPANVPPLGA